MQLLWGDGINACTKYGCLTYRQHVLFNPKLNMLQDIRILKENDVPINMHIPITLLNQTPGFFTVSDNSKPYCSK